MKRILVLALLMTACGNAEDFSHTRNFGWDVDHKKEVSLGSYTSLVDEFLSYAEVYGQPQNITDLIIKTEDLPTPLQLGLCQLREDSTPIIIVDSESWDALGETRQMALIFHELGHCILRRVHVEPTYEFQSLMSPYLITEERFLDNFDEILTEFFDPATFNSWRL